MGTHPDQFRNLRLRIQPRLVPGEDAAGCSPDGWTRLDFTAIYTIKRLEIRAKVINLLDEDYEVGGTVTRPLPRYGRGFELSLGYSF